VAVAATIVVSVAAQPRRGEAPKSNDQRFEVKVTDEMIRHSRITDTLYFVGAAWSAAMMLVLLVTGASRWMRDVAARVTKQPFLLAMIYIVLFTIATAILSFPLTYYSDFMV